MKNRMKINWSSGDHGTRCSSGTSTAEFSLHGPTSLTHLADIDPKRIGKVAVAMKPLRDIMRKREEQGKLGWTLCSFPTDELARHAKLTLEQYTEQIHQGLLPGPAGPGQGLGDRV